MKIRWCERPNSVGMNNETPLSEFRNSLAWTSRLRVDLEYQGSRGGRSDGGDTARGQFPPSDIKHSKNSASSIFIMMSPNHAVRRNRDAPPLALRPPREPSIAESKLPLVAQADLRGRDRIQAIQCVAKTLHRTRLLNPHQSPQPQKAPRIRNGPEALPIVGKPTSLHQKNTPYAHNLAAQQSRR